jgi:hypothetical protein
VELVCAHALLGGAQQVHRQEPFVDRYLGSLHDGADRHRELLAAVVALDDAGAVRLALQPGDALLLAAVGADRAVRPQATLQVLAGGILVGEDRF